MAEALRDLARKTVDWRKTAAEGLDVDYVLLLSRSLADELMMRLEEAVEYYDGELSKVKIKLTVVCRSYVCVSGLVYSLVYTSRVRCVFYKLLECKLYLPGVF